MKKRLSIVSTSPVPNGINVKKDVVIRIAFDKDISKSSMSGNVHMVNGNGEKVDSIISYSNREISLSPRVPLLPSTTYRVVVRGNNDPDNEDAYKGLTSPIGEYMLGDYTFVFSTGVPAKETEYVVDMSPNNIVMEEQPTLKGGVTSDTENAIVRIDIEVSSSNSFEPSLAVWSGTCNVEDFENGILCDSYLEDGSYYWRARAVSSTEGAWSDICRFAIDRYANNSIVAEDHIETDIAFPDSWGMMDAKIVGIYPDDNRSSVPTNLKTISIVFDKIIPDEELRYANFSISGEAADGDTYSQSHGELNPTVDVVYDHDNGFTILVITLPVYEGEVGI